MFKNYTVGNLDSVFYIKNLAKDVVPEDFYFIFGSLFGSVDAAKPGLNVKLMGGMLEFTVPDSGLPAETRVASVYCGFWIRTSFRRQSFKLMYGFNIYSFHELYHVLFYEYILPKSKFYLVFISYLHD